MKNFERSSVLEKGLAVLSFAYSALRHIEVRGIFQFRQAQRQPAIDRAFTELEILWKEYVERLPKSSLRGLALNIQGWQTLQILEGDLAARFVSHQEVVDPSTGPPFRRAYEYDREWWQKPAGTRILVEEGLPVSSIVNDLTDLFIRVDIDTHNEFKRLKTTLNAAFLAQLSRASFTINRSPSGRGLHLSLEFPSTLSTSSRFEVRRTLGDCSGRLHYSEERGLDDVLYNMKRRRRKGHWPAWAQESAMDIKNVLCLPFWCRAPALRGR